MLRASLEGSDGLEKGSETGFNRKRVFQFERGRIFEVDQAGGVRTDAPSDRLAGADGLDLEKGVEVGTDLIVQRRPNRAREPFQDVAVLISVVVDMGEDENVRTEVFGTEELEKVSDELLRGEVVGLGLLRRRVESLRVAEGGVGAGGKGVDYDYGVCAPLGRDAQILGGVLPAIELLQRGDESGRRAVDEGEDFGGGPDHHDWIVDALHLVGESLVRDVAELVRAFTLDELDKGPEEIVEVVHAELVAGFNEGGQSPGFTRAGFSDEDAFDEF